MYILKIANLCEKYHIFSFSLLNQNTDTLHKEYSVIDHKKQTNHLLIMLTLVLVGLNLRPSMAALGPLLPFIRQDIAFSFTQISLLTMLPVLSMGCAMFGSSYLLKKIVPFKLVLFSLCVIGVSNILRFFAEHSAINLVVTAITAGCGIAIIQAILPVFIKKTFPNAIALYMGVYVTAIMGGAALAASSVSFVQAYTHRWQAALSIWFVLSIIAIGLWYLIKNSITSIEQSNENVSYQFYKIPRTWILILFFGLGTASYTCVLAWLPPYYIEHGWTTTQSGLILAALTGVEVIAGLIFPALSNRSEDRRWVLLIILMCCILGYVGIIFLPNTFTFLWIALLGLGIGGLFPMSLIITMDHLKSPQHAGALTAFVQGGGYLIAALSPFFAGMIRDVTGSFVMAWSALLFLTCILVLIALLFNPKLYQEKMKS